MTLKTVSPHKRAGPRLGIIPPSGVDKPHLDSETPLLHFILATRHFSPLIMMSYRIAAEVGQSYNDSNTDVESADTVHLMSPSKISELHSAHHHPNHKKSKRQARGSRIAGGYPGDASLGTQILVKGPAPLAKDTRPPGFHWWPSSQDMTQGYASLEEVDLSDLPTPSGIRSESQSVQALADHHPHSHDPSHSPTRLHSDNQAEDRPDGHCDTQRHSHDYDQYHNHSHTHSNELQPLLPEAATRSLRAVTDSVKSIFAPADDICAPDTSVIKMLWTCVLTMASQTDEGESHHEHPHADHGHSHADHDHSHGNGHSHSAVHTEQYQSPPPLPTTMADWEDHFTEQCRNPDGSRCTSSYHGSAVRGHSHM